MPSRWLDPRTGEPTHERWIHARRLGSLVYVRTLKAASEAVWRGLGHAWEITDWNHIDWQQDRVWSLIRHPVIRRAAGMAEYIQRQGAAQWCWHLESLQNLIQWTPALDEHSAPLHWYYGDRVGDIQWIPMQESDPAITRGRVDQWLAQQGAAAVAWPDRHREHRGDQEYQRIKQWILESWQAPDRMPDWCRTALEPDWQLWCRVCAEWNQDAQWRLPALDQGCSGAEKNSAAVSLRL